MQRFREEVYQLHALICKTLGEPKRLMIIDRLRLGEADVGELAAALGLRQANVSQHLAVMRERGLVTYRKVGANVYYSLVSPKIVAACEMIREVLAEQLERSRALAASLGSTDD